jgi:hypothetical protein
MTSCQNVVIEMARLVCLESEFMIYMNAFGAYKHRDGFTRWNEIDAT